MRRMHVTAISLLLGGCVVAGTAAALRSVRLGAGAAAARAVRVPDAVVAARRARLDRWSAELEKARSRRPPALPRIPKFAPVAIPTPPARPVADTTPDAATANAPSASAAPAQPAVTYVRPPPVVTYRQAPAGPAPAPPVAPTGGEAEHERGERTGEGD